ncbi:hypothetical protein [Sedimenticola selenatireducens]|uniref:Periplasmic heavy metal sensor n=1 Tax=Sedimenticola selenatireducens TaxID=191960 RepID=A0A557SLZ6_9GAMM|nr:hypothetical protein [Sedimenticola selenatireducens]TVO78437.1 hypothetical protein FHP88_01865 [Sedimenticola selenatireducens]TVT62704.1 MAG: hypothetical protein FHK78_13590 [Sedimenticola selenatireducens]
MVIRKTIVATIAAITLTSSVYAMGPGKDGPCGGGPPPAPPNIEQLTNKLDLTEEQAASLKQLFDSQKERHREKGKERRKAHDQMHEKIASILTPSQMEAFIAMKPAGCRKQ